MCECASVCLYVWVCVISNLAKWQPSTLELFEFRQLLYVCISYLLYHNSKRKEMKKTAEEEKKACAIFPPILKRKILHGWWQVCTAHVHAAVQTHTYTHMRYCHNVPTIVCVHVYGAVVACCCECVLCASLELFYPSIGGTFCSFPSIQIPTIGKYWANRW